MGVHGLTTFVASYGDKYKEKIYVRDSPILIDGCNLMYYLYFDGKQAVVERGAQGGQRGVGTKSEKQLKAFPDAYLFGGDWDLYAQNVRYFFQQLKECRIIPIVLLDGAYDSSKLDVAKIRFAKNVNDNINKPSEPNSKEFPGKTYTPIFLKTVFLEVLAEQKITHFQTVAEADPTIAYVAKLLSQCPILSSDSDFLIYANAKAIPLASVRFAKAKQNKKLRARTIDQLSDKVLTLQAEFVSLPKLCREEFKMDDAKLLGLAAVILGNDKVQSNVFRHFVCGSGSLDLKQRIAKVMHWLARQGSVEIAQIALLESVSADRRDTLAFEIQTSLNEYNGEGGEYRIWQYLTELVDLRKWIDRDAEEKLQFHQIFQTVASGTVRVPKPKKESNVKRAAAALRLLRQKEEKEAAEDDGVVNNAAEQDTIGTIGEIIDCPLDNSETVVVIALPDWYVECHVRCLMQTYLLNVLRSRIVFLPPQIEIYNRPSSHDMSIPIIQVIAGILVSDQTLPVELVTHSKNTVTKKLILPVISLPELGPIPALVRKPGQSAQTVKDLSELSADDRVDIMYAAFGFYENKSLRKFVEGFPGSIRLWILTLLYYTKQELHYMESGTQCVGLHDCIAVSTAVFLIVMKNLMVNPGKGIKNSGGNPCITALNILVDVADQEPGKLAEIRKFYEGFETLSPTARKHLKRNYDINIPYELSKYICLLYHTEMLNNLLGDPFKSPKVRYTLNNCFIYKFAEKLSRSTRRIFSDTDFKKYEELIQEVVEIQEIQNVAVTFFQVLTCGLF